jgi:hypothetical protein
MSYPFNYPTPQSANIQTFYSGATTGTQTWVKPQGASFVWFTLIGAGGGGDSGTAQGGGSGAVTNCMVPAFLIPDILRVAVGAGGAANTAGSSTRIIYQGSKASAGYELITANGGDGGALGTGGTASTSNYFSAMGFFQSVAGQNGWFAGTNGASATTFLSGGTDSTTSTANYGYSTYVGAGFFQMQPIIVSASNALGAFKAGIGCGGSSNDTVGGDGMVTIISW